MEDDEEAGFANGENYNNDCYDDLRGFRWKSDLKYYSMSFALGKPDFAEALGPDRAYVLDSCCAGWLSSRYISHSGSHVSYGLMEFMFSAIGSGGSSFHSPSGNNIQYPSTSYLRNYKSWVAEYNLLIEPIVDLNFDLSVKFLGKNDYGYNVWKLD